MNRSEYNEAVNAYSGRLFRFIVKSTCNREDANDIVQDSFLKLWEFRQKVDPEKARSWLFTTAHRMMLNMLRKSARSRYLDDVSFLEPKTNGVPRFELREIIDKCLDRLPELQRSIILLRDLEGYNYKEIGEILNLNESQVKVYLFRGRQKIKKQIKELNIRV